MRLKISGSTSGKHDVLTASNNRFQLIDMDTGKVLTGVKDFILTAEANNIVQCQITFYPGEIDIDLEGVNVSRFSG